MDVELVVEVVVELEVVLVVDEEVLDVLVTVDVLAAAGAIAVVAAISACGMESSTVPHPVSSNAPTANDATSLLNAGLRDL